MTGLATLRQISLTRKRLFYKNNFFTFRVLNCFFITTVLFKTCNYNGKAFEMGD